MKLSIDIGGTYCRYLINDELFIEKTQDIAILEFLEALVAKFSITTLNISFAGMVHQGHIVQAPNINIEPLDIIKHFAPLRVNIANDLNCALLAYQNDIQSDSLAIIYIGTGLGLSVMDGGHIITGINGVATELGHIPFKESTLTCGCGKNNCIEIFASGSGIMKQKRLYNVEECLSIDSLRGHIIYNECLRASSYAIATTLALFNPKHLILGGGLIENSTYLYEDILKTLPNDALGIALKSVTINKAYIDNAPLYGAHLL